MNYQGFQSFLLLIIIVTCTSAEHTLVGHWTFEEGEEYKDLTGNFDDIVLHGASPIVLDGSLDLDIHEWAIALNYQGQTIGEKTLVSWVSVDNLEVQHGAALSIDKQSYDGYDAIVFGEQKPYHWIAGSSNFFRTITDLDPGFDGTKANETIQLAISYENNGGSPRIRLYKDGEIFGDYTKGPFETWSAGDAEAIWGYRHTDSAHNPPVAHGSLDAHIIESRIYANVLTDVDLKRLTPKSENYYYPNY